jgi:hypothetical protein
MATSLHNCYRVFSRRRRLMCGWLVCGTCLRSTETLVNSVLKRITQSAAAGLAAGLSTTYASDKMRKSFCCNNILISMVC